MWYQWKVHSLNCISPSHIVALIKIVINRYLFVLHTLELLENLEGAMNLRALLAFTIICLMLTATSAHARLLIDPGRPNSPIVGQVNECLAEIDAAGNPFKAIVDWLRQSRTTHTIRSSSSPGASSSTTSGALQLPGGTPGPGANSTIDWNPDYTGPSRAGDRFDPCASLLHELYHAFESDQGLGDQSAEPGTGNATATPPQPPIARSEIRGSRFENRFRDHIGRPPPPDNQRGFYGNTPLPANAMAPF